ncbi:MAG: HD domain-containing phosphohydrolase [Pseudomonadota bacterium]
MTENTVFSILLVDDEVAILKSLQRLFRKTGYRVLTANGGREGLEILKVEKETVALIISDQRMPEMNGAQFLEHAKAIVPDALRFLLTGYSELSSLADSINKGEIHRYITKPWEDEDLLTLARQAVEQYELKKENQRLTELTKRQNQELSEFNKTLEQKVEERTRELQQKQKELEAGLYNSIRSFTSLLNMHASGLGEHGRRVSFLSGKLAEQLKLPEEKVSRIELAGLLHDIGKLGLSPNLITYNTQDWTEEENIQYVRHPVQGQQIVQFINQLSGVGLMIRSHHERYDGEGFPDGLSGDKIPLGSKIIAVADAYDKMVNLEVDADSIIETFLAEGLKKYRDLPRNTLLQQAALYNLKKNAFSHYDPDLLKILLVIFKQTKLAKESETLVPVTDLQPGMVLSNALYSVKGHFLLAKNTTLLSEHIPKLAALYNIQLIEENISIRVVES